MELGSGLAGDGESRDERGIFGRWGGVMMARCGTLCFSSCKCLGRNFGEFVGMILTRKVVVLWVLCKGSLFYSHC